MADIKKRVAVFLGSLLLIFAITLTILPIPIVVASNYPLSSSDDKVVNALDYLRNIQTTQGDIGGFATSAWVSMAIAAAGEDPHDWKVGSNSSIVDYLETHAGDANLSIAPDVERMILAIVAAHESPTDFGGIDFVDALKTLYDDGQIGDASLLNDDFWGVMALVSAGESASSATIANSVAFVKDNQNGDGGWSWGVGQGSDVDDTACAVMALIAAGENPGSNGITNALNYIKSQQADNGGFLSWGATNPSTDSWAIDAIVAAEQNPTNESWTNATSNKTPVDDLLSFQNVTDGSFPDYPGNPSPWITAYAIPSLLGKPYPVKVLEPQEAVSVYVRVEGQSSAIWSGNVTVTESNITADNSGTTYQLSDPTALGALDEASKHEEKFSYYVTDEYGGLYAKSIAGEQPSGASGWMYRIDHYSPSVGADQFVLGETTPPAPPHEEVLFYYGTWIDLPLRISVNKTAVAKGEEFSVTVSVYNDTAHDWSACENATVCADHDYTTGSDGKVNITIDRDGTFKVFAEKSGCIRSDKVLVEVGTGVESSQGQVSLSATIVPAISIEVTPDSINFGNLAPGYTSDAHTVTIENKGGLPVTVTAEVTDQSQGLFRNGLKLDNNSWHSFNETINVNDNLETQAKLAVPLDYAGVGTKAGTLIFWAEES
jgi:hypothetical protein